MFRIPKLVLQPKFYGMLITARLSFSTTNQLCAFSVADSNPLSEVPPSSAESLSILNHIFVQTWTICSNSFWKVKKDSSEQSCKGDKMQSDWEGNFPQDVVNEILVWLPIKSLLRFKCVCKNWYAVIQSPVFVTKHFNHESNGTRLLLCYTPDLMYLLPDSILTCIPSSNGVIDRILSPQIAQHLIGPIDGLFFLHGFRSGDSMTLWNPSTREFRSIPVPPPIIPPSFNAYHTFGFGLDPLTGNYKVIWIRYLEDTRTGNPLPYFVVAVYTLVSDTWRYLDPLIHTKCDLWNSHSATCINGAYYWLVSYNHTKHSILSFDMSLEVFREIAGPDHSDETHVSLTLCNESIALFLCEFGLQSIIEICVMKEEGCWYKLVTFTLFIRDVCRPLEFWNNEEVLLETGSSDLFLYKYDTHELRNFGIYDDSKAAFSYKESLLSVKGENKDSKGCDFSDTVADDLRFTVSATSDNALVDKTDELAKLIECFSHKQELYYRQDRLRDEFANVHGLPKDDLAKGLQMIMEDPAKLETFFDLDGAQRNLYVEELVHGG